MSGQAFERKNYTTALHSLGGALTSVGSACGDCAVPQLQVPRTRWLGTLTIVMAHTCIYSYGLPQTMWLGTLRIVMTYIVRACIVMAYIVMTYKVMA